MIETLKSKIEEADASEKPCEDEIEGEGEGEQEQEEEGKDGSNGNESSRPVETRKRAKVVVNGGEENDSPSSPVHVDDLE